MILKCIIPVIIMSLLFLLPHSEQSGIIALVGGNDIPLELKTYLREGNYIVVATNPASAIERWGHIANVYRYLLPEELSFDIFTTPNFAGVIINGGDQWQYLTRLNGAVIQAVHLRGYDVIGTSAGAMILGEYYFSAQYGGVTSDEVAGQLLPIGHNFVSFSQLKSTIVDTHYSERKREGRLREFMTQCGAKVGIGIDESTVLIIHHAYSISVGKGKVHYLKG